MRKFKKKKSDIPVVLGDYFLLRIQALFSRYLGSKAGLIHAQHVLQHFGLSWAFNFFWVFCLGAAFS